MTPSLCGLVPDLCANSITPLFVCCPRIVCFLKRRWIETKLRQGITYDSARHYRLVPPRCGCFSGCLRCVRGLFLLRLHVHVILSVCLFASPLSPRPILFSAYVSACESLTVTVFCSPLSSSLCFRCRCVFPPLLLFHFIMFRSFFIE